MSNSIESYKIRKSGKEMVAGSRPIIRWAAFKKPGQRDWAVLSLRDDAKSRSCLTLTGFKIM